MFDPNQVDDPIERCFTEDYVQTTNGQELDLSTFRSHVGSLRGDIAEIAFTFERVVCDGDTIAEVHRVEGTKHDGSRLEDRVFAFHTIRNGRIARLDELIQPIV